MTFVSLTSLKMLFIAALPTLETLETGASISHHKHRADTGPALLDYKVRGQFEN